MGKAARFFRSILGLKSSDSDRHKTANNKQRKWSFVKSYREKQTTNTNTNTNTAQFDDSDDPNKHAIAVAAATAAVAEAAVAAAHAAAAVVRLTSASGRRCSDNIHHASGGRLHFAALKIQSVFRGYLARRALRALKGLVRLQALVRGHIQRRRTAEWIRQMQALLRAQARVRAGWFQVSDSPNSIGKSSHSSHPGPATPEKFEYSIRARSINYDQPSLFKRNCSNPHGRINDDQDGTTSSWNWWGRSSDRQMSMKIFSQDEQKHDKILEVDTGKSHTVPKHKKKLSCNRQSFINDHDSLTVSKDSSTHLSVPSSYSCEVPSLSPFNFPNEVEESLLCTGTNSPQIFSANSKGRSSRGSPFTPTRSDVSRSYLSGYSDCPSYMAYTECSRAKVRSLSAPKQRPPFERSNSIKRYSIHGVADTNLGTEKVSSLHTSFMSKAYPGSGRLDRLGMPVRGEALGYKY